MCFQFKPPDPLPEPVPPLTDLDRLIDDLIAFAGAWAGAHLHGNWTVADARKKVRLETERLRCIESMKRQGL
jgi:hypothetical protein